MTVRVGVVPLQVILQAAQLAVLRFRADIDKDIEILVLRHQLTVLRRQVTRVRTNRPIEPSLPYCRGC